MKNQKTIIIILSVSLSVSLLLLWGAYTWEGKVLRTLREEKRQYVEFKDSILLENEHLNDIIKDLNNDIADYINIVQIKEHQIQQSNHRLNVLLKRSEAINKVKIEKTIDENSLSSYWDSIYGSR